MKNDAKKRYNDECIRQQWRAKQGASFDEIAEGYDKAIRGYMDAFDPYRPPPHPKQGDQKPKIGADGRYDPRSFDVYPLEWAGDVLDRLAQEIAKREAEEAARNRSAEEWRQMEREYIHHRTRYSWEDLKADILNAADFDAYLRQRLAVMDPWDRIECDIESIRREWERIRITPEEAQRLLKCLHWFYRECDFVFCQNVFKRRGPKRFCSDKCRSAQRHAEARFKETSEKYANGTYLPRDAYIPKYDESVAKSIRTNEIVCDPIAGDEDENAMIDLIRFPRYAKNFAGAAQKPCATSYKVSNKKRYMVRPLPYEGKARRAKPSGPAFYFAV